MNRRFAIAGLAVVTACALTLPAQAEPPYRPVTTKTSRFERLDVTKLNKIVNRPAAADKDKMVSALVELSGDPVAVKQVNANGRFDRVAAKRRVVERQNAAMPELTRAGARTYGRLTTVLNAVQVRVKVSDLDDVANVAGVKTVQVSSTVKLQNARSEQFTGVDRTWEELKYTGKGQVVGVIDTGVDYTHADFGGPGTPTAFENNDGAVIEPGTFPTAKVTGGYDFVGDDYDILSDDEAKATPKPDPDPLDCNGHGSHVAGTAAGSGVTDAGATYAGPYNKAILNNSWDVEPGVAPEATIKAYRVFGCEGSAGDDVIIAAMDRAVSDGVDVINLSLGSSYGVANNLDRVAVDAATAAGTLVVAAAGNDGLSAYITSAPGTSNAALAVAAVDTETPTFPAVRITGAVTATGINANGATVSGVTAPLVDVGLGCDRANFVGVAGKIALTSRGVCPRIDRATLGQQAGAVAVIMINDSPGLPPFEGDIEGVTIPFVGVDQAASAAFLAANGQSVSLAAADPLANPAYRTPASFTSNGPRRLDNAQKPEVAAPGVSIPSVLAGSGTGATRISGTSMATPHTAGVAALVGQAHPAWSPKRVKAAIMNTAAPNLVEGYDSQRVGTGVVQPRRATISKAYAWTANGLDSLRYGKNQLAGAHTETHSFKITNRASSRITYDLRSVLSSDRYGADITISPKTVKVTPGKTKTVKVKIHLSRSDVAKLPGASASDGGELITLRGLIVANPRGSRKGVFSLRVPFLFTPVPLSKITSSATVTKVGGSYSPITVRNGGIRTGTANLYTWLLADPAGDALNTEAADLTNLGVQSLPGQLVEEDPSNRLLVFAAAQATGTSTQATRRVDVFTDVDGDDEPDFITIAADTGEVIAQSADGTVAAFTFNLANGELVDAWAVTAPANGSTIELPVLASSLGITDATGPVDVTATGRAGYTAAGDSTFEFPEPDDTIDGTAAFDPYAPALSQGDLITVDPGESAIIPVTVDESALGSQAHSGWLVVSLDDRAGLWEADRVKLVAATPVAKKAQVKRR